MANIITALVIVAILSFSGFKIYRDRKKGSKCAGCPLSSGKNSSCGCH